MRAVQRRSRDFKEITSFGDLLDDRARNLEAPQLIECGYPEKLRKRARRAMNKLSGTRGPVIKQIMVSLPMQGVRDHSVTSKEKLAGNAT